VRWARVVHALECGGSNVQSGLNAEREKQLKTTSTIVDRDEPPLSSPRRDGKTKRCSMIETKEVVLSPYFATRREYENGMKGVASRRVEGSTPEDERRE
jgi:hypothetical protein